MSDKVPFCSDFLAFSSPSDPFCSAEFVPTTYWEIFKHVGNEITWIGEAVNWIGSLFPNSVHFPFLPYFLDIERDVPDFESRGRALVRYFLNHKMLSSAMATFLAKDLIDDYYEESAIFRKGTTS